MAVLWIAADDEVIEITALERIFFEGEAFVAAQIIDPEPSMHIEFAEKTGNRRASLARMR